MTERTIEPREATPDRVRTRADFAAELSLLRNQAGLSLRDLSSRIDALQGHTTLGDWFAGRSVPSASSEPLLTRVLQECGVTDIDDIENWLRVWRLVRRSPGPKSGAPPYRGLAGFQPTDADWFFGREALTEQITARVMALHAEGGGLQIVVGASGSGKSSLLRAGVIPALSSHKAPGRPSWPFVLLTPGAEPVNELATVLAAGTGMAPQALAAEMRLDPLGTIATHLPGYATGASRSDPVAGAARADRLLIVVDQFEELFTMCLDDQERRTFIAALIAAARPAVPVNGSVPPVAAVVLLGLRADFYPSALQYAELAGVLQNAQFVVGPPTAAELRRAIVEPAIKSNVQIDEGLVELLLRETVAGPVSSGLEPSPAGALPLLSHALLATWQRSERGRMTTSGYLASGGITKAVARTAEEVFGDLSVVQRTIARRVFLRLVNLGDDGPDTRRKATLGELEGLAGSAAELDEVIEHFVAARLLTMDSGTVEISHEALLTAWPKLKGWIDADRDGLRVQRQLSDAAVQWRDRQCDPEDLYQGGRLDAVRDWTAPATSGRDLNPLEIEFVTASVERERQSQAADRRRTRRLKRLVAALVVLVVLSAGLTAYSGWKRAAANDARDMAMSRQVASTANRLRATDPALAAQFSLAAYRIAPTMEARSSLLDATGLPPVTRIVRPSNGGQNIVLSPDGTTMYGAGTGPSDTAILTWDLRDARRPRLVGEQLTAHTLPVFGLAISPDGKLLASGGRDKIIRLWNVTDPAHPVALGPLRESPTETVYSLAFAPDGRTLAAGSADRTVRLWDVSDAARAQPLKSLPAGAGFVQSVVFSDDGRVLVAGDSAGTLFAWDTTAMRAPRRLLARQAASQQINTVAFAPRSRTLVLGGVKGLLQVWDLTDPAAADQRQTAIAVPENWVNAIAFSPDGRWVAIGSSENVAQVWDLRTGRLVAELPHSEPVSSVVFGDRGRTLITSGSDGVVRQWSVPGPVMTGATATVAAAAFSPDGRLLTFFGGQGLLWDVTHPRSPAALSEGLKSPLTDEPVSGAGALSPDGRILAAGTAGTSVLLWDVADPLRPQSLGPPLTGPTAVVESLAFSPDGRLLVAGGDDGKVRLWDLSIPRRPVALPVAPGGDGNYIYMVAVSPDGRTLVGVTADGMIRLWDLTDPRRLRELPAVKGSADLLYSAAFSVDGSILATGSADGSVRLWDVRNPAAVAPIGAPLRDPDGTVAAVAFGPDRRTLAASTRSGQVWFWDVSSPDRPVTVSMLSASRAAIWALGFSPDGHTVVTGGTDRTVRLWETDPLRAADLVCAGGGDDVSADEWEKYLPGVPYRKVC